MSEVSIRTPLRLLANAPDFDNPGLALERYVARVGKILEPESDERSAFWTAVTGSKPSAVYNAAYRRWEQQLAHLGAKSATLKVADRLIVGLGAESALETAITLNRMYGVPMIPGSALKGLARRYYRDVFGDDANFKTLFGEQESAGYVTYLDAWYIPESAKDDRPIRRDVMTVHHPKYYSSGEKDAAPTDFDDPNPVSFVSAVGSYLVSVIAPSDEWTEFALDALKRALADYGVGGKTSSGYGRLVEPGQGKLKAAPRVETAEEQAMPIRRAIDSLGGANEVSRVEGIVSRMEGIADAEMRVELARLLHAKLVLWKAWNKEKHREKDWHVKLAQWVSDDP